MEEENSRNVPKLTRCEQEVVLRIDEEDKTWSAYVSSPYFMRKFEKAGWKCIDTQFYKSGEVMSKTYKAPRKCVYIMKEKEKRNLSEEEKEILRERIKIMHASKLKKNSDYAEEITVGEIGTLQLDLPDELSIKDLVWSSSDESVVKVNSDGRYIGISEGFAVVSVKTKNEKYMSTCFMSVLENVENNLD